MCREQCQDKRADMMTKAKHNLLLRTGLPQHNGRHVAAFGVKFCVGVGEEPYRPQRFGNCISHF